MQTYGGVFLNNYHHLKSRVSRPLLSYNTTQIQIYVNGKLENSATTTLTPLASHTLVIGSLATTNYFTNGTIDEVMVWNRALSEQEINATYNSAVYPLYRNFTNLAGATYTYKAYAVDQAGNWNETLTRTVVVNNKPSITSVQLNATSTFNRTDDNLTAYVNGLTDLDSDSTTTIYDWRKGGISDNVLNMPFDSNNSAGDGKQKDYSSFSHNGTLVDGPTFNSSCGVFAGSGGCYEFNGVDDYITNGNIGISANASSSYNVWVRFDQAASEKVNHNAIFYSSSAAVLYQHSANDYLYTNGAEYFGACSEPTIGVWTNYVLTFSGDTSTGILYKDGSADRKSVV